MDERKRTYIHTTVEPYRLSLGRFSFFLIFVPICFLLAVVSGVRAEIAGTITSVSSFKKSWTLNTFEVEALGLEEKENKDLSTPDKISFSAIYLSKTKVDKDIPLKLSVRISSTQSFNSNTFEKITAGCTQCRYPDCRPLWGDYSFEGPCYSRFKNGYLNFRAWDRNRNRCRFGGVSEFSVSGYYISVVSEKLSYSMPREHWDEVKNRHIELANALARKVMNPNGMIFDVTANRLLTKGDSVSFGRNYKTQRGQTAKIKLNSDGIDTTIIIRPNTEIRIVKKFKKNKRSGIYLLFGRIWSLFKGKKKGKYAVETFNSVAAVEGTAFETAYDQATGKTTVSVSEGVVRFECKNGDDAPLMVKAGMQASLDKSCNLTTTTIDPANIKSVVNTTVIPDTPVNLSSGGTTVNVNNTGSSNDGRVKPIADAYVYAYSYRNWNKANWGKHTILETGWHPTGGEKRAYLKFDLTGVDSKDVNKATLKLFHNHTGGNGSLAIGIHAVSSTWREGSGTYHSGQTEKPAAAGEISWVAQPSFSPYQSANFKPGSATNKHIEVDITQLVKQWLAGTANNGLVLKVAGNLNKNLPESSYGFYSREYKDADKRPVLVLSGSSVPDTPAGNKHPLGDITRISDHPQAAKNIRGVPCGTDRAFVYSMIQSILERDPSQGEVAKLVQELQNGLSRKDLVVRLFQSREYTKGGFEAYRDAFQAVLGREPQPHEFKTFPRTWPYMMAVGLFETDEYRNLCPGNDDIDKPVQEKGYNPLNDTGMGVPSEVQSTGKTDDLVKKYQKQLFPDSRKDPEKKQQAVYEQPSDYTGGGVGSTSKPIEDDKKIDEMDTSVANVGELECAKNAQQAYKQYIEAYNRLNYFMSRGRGDEPGAQTAYESYKFYKDCYELINPPATSTNEDATDNYHKQQPQ